MRENLERKTKNIIIAVVLVVGLILLIPEVNDAVTGFWQDVLINTNSFGSEQTEYPVKVHVIDVGQGDSIFIESDGGNILIDAGEIGNEKIVVQYLKNLGVRTIDYVIATHAHSDHIGSMPEVLESFSISNIISTKYSKINTPTSWIYEDFINAAKQTGAKRIVAKPGDTYTLSDMTFTVLAPINQREQLNNMSVVIRMTYGERSFLLMGDAETAEETDILKSGAEINSDFIKIGHHGSSSSSSKKFIDAVSPCIAVISCGKNNDYGHPHKETLSTLISSGVKMYRTDYSGSVVVSTDGEKLEVSHSGHYEKITFTNLQEDAA